MSKHDIERVKARKAPEVAAKRSAKKASIKRSMTMTVKAVAATATVTAGAAAVNGILKKYNVAYKGKRLYATSNDLRNLGKFIKKGKNMMGYFY